MSDQTKPAPGGKNAPKKPYSPPRVIDYGHAADLTGGGVASKPESNRNQSMKHA